MNGDEAGLPGLLLSADREVWLGNFFGAVAAANLGLVRVKRRLGANPGGFEAPIRVPAFGFAACSLFAAFRLAAFLGGVR